MEEILAFAVIAGVGVFSISVLLYLDSRRFRAIVQDKEPKTDAS